MTVSCGLEGTTLIGEGLLGLWGVNGDAFGLTVVGGDM